MTLAELLQGYKSVLQTDDHNRMARFFKSVETLPLPTALALNKARIIQLSEGNEYALEDAEKLLRSIIETDPEAVPAYIELGYMLDTVFCRSQEAVEICEEGIAEALKQLRDLHYAKAAAQISCEKYDHALQTLEAYRQNEERFERLYEEAQEMFLEQQKRGNEVTDAALNELSKGL